MKRKILCVLVVFCMLADVMLPLNIPTVMAADEAVSAIFGGGPFYQGGQSVMNDLRSSGFNTVIIWSVHVNANGDLVLNDSLVCSGGSYVGDPAWKTQWATLKTAPTSVKRIEVSVGAWGCADFEHIRDLINSQGTGANTVLYKNFAALKAATGADAVDFDDESCYDVASAVKFGQMCASMGYKVTLCPYTNSGFWSSVKSQLGSTVDRIYLQCYAGGAGNNPATWSSTMGMKVIPGLWCLHGSSGDTASTVKSKLTNWKSSSVGGFMWLYDDMQKLSSPNATKDYASAINSAFTTPASNGVVFYQDINYSGAKTGEIPKGRYTLSQLQAYGFVDNWASSVVIPSGWSVRMYTDDNFQGTSWMLNQNDSNSANFTNFGGNDKVTSCEIY